MLPLLRKYNDFVSCFLQLLRTFLFASSSFFLRVCKGLNISNCLRCSFANAILKIVAHQGHFVVIISLPFFKKNEKYKMMTQNLQNPSRHKSGLALKSVSKVHFSNLVVSWLCIRYDRKREGKSLLKKQHNGKTQTFHFHLEKIS